MWIQLAVTGLLAAMLPLGLVWVSSDPDKYRKLVWVTVFFTFDVIMFGAFTRLTDSGLGCPDWPGCYSEANPFLAHEAIRAAETLMPTGPVTVVKAWIEMIHRYLAMGIGVLIVTIMAVAWRNWLRGKRSQPRFAPLLPTWLLFHVCLLGAFGAWTVTQKLQPIFVTGHLLLAMSLLAALTWLGCKAGAAPAPTATAAPAPRGLRLAAALAMALLFAQIALGGWTSSNYAALACSEFPQCGGQWVPEMDFEHGFALWRELGKTAAGHYLPFAALTAIHWVHRNFAFVVAVAVAWTGVAALRAGPRFRRPARWLLAVLAIQFATGLATIFLSWPLAIAVAHNGGAALLVFFLTVVNYRARLSPPPIRP